MNHWMQYAAVVVGTSLLLTITARADAPQGTTGLASPPINVPLANDGVQRAEVVLDSYSFKPSHLVVAAGKPVELVLKNISGIAPHNLTLDNPAGGLAVNQDVKAGTSAKVQFTPQKPGVYTFYCNKKLLMFPSHRAKGMEGVLEVQ